MDNIFLIGALVSLIFFIAKFLEMRFVEKQNKPLKFLIRDSLLVYFCVIIGYVIIQQVHPLIMEGGVKVSTPAVFTDNPGF